MNASSETRYAAWMPDTAETVRQSAPSSRSAIAAIAMSGTMSVETFRTMPMSDESCRNRATMPSTAFATSLKRSRRGKYVQNAAPSSRSRTPTAGTSNAAAMTLASFGPTPRAWSHRAGAVPSITKNRLKNR